MHPGINQNPVQSLTRGGGLGLDVGVGPLLSQVYPYGHDVFSVDQDVLHFT